MCSITLKTNKPTNLAKMGFFFFSHKKTFLWEVIPVFLGAGVDLCGARRERWCLGEEDADRGRRPWGAMTQGTMENSRERGSGQEVTEMEPFRAAPEMVAGPRFANVGGMGTDSFHCDLKETVLKGRRIRGHGWEGRLVECL